ncbi:hydroxymethylglutaryl-CoA lyase [Bacteriovorax sp. Seq25_V]|uniref:hydroxymethylglutaryl-CoA lyase n=1 Tax=Bacteriovorax sp. Seq25_V TaxID=1201288 RepID=UPI00038A09FD|nr:hydroxymethylglutaryl-CoA lyase [Bacteriovorax sp. Seq25_V]EQC44004.1 HMGL-like protein [Bacteriovorax sp. Seq25_V]
MTNNNVKIVEVGPRDGLQNEKNLVSLEVKVNFIKKLLAAGIRSLEVTSFVRPDKIPQMSDASELFPLIKEFARDMAVELPCLVPNLIGLNSALGLGVDHIALFSATSNTFNKKNINATVDESFSRLQEVVEYVKSSGKAVKMRGYVSTVFGCPYEGEIDLDHTLKVIEKMRDLGVDEISLGDTIGVANPIQVQTLITALKKNFDLSKIAMHFHDTEGMAVANIYTSFNEGIRIFDSSAAGLGGCPYAKGATGNVATDDVVNLFDKMNVNTGIDASKLHEASSYILENLGKQGGSKFFHAFEGRKS